MLALIAQLHLELSLHWHCSPVWVVSRAEVLFTGDLEISLALVSDPFPLPLVTASHLPPKLP